MKVCDINVSSTLELGDPYIWADDCEDTLDKLEGTTANRNPCGFVSHLGECSADHQDTCPVECGLCDKCFMYKCMDAAATTDPLADPEYLAVPSFTSADSTATGTTLAP